MLLLNAERECGMKTLHTPVTNLPMLEPTTEPDSANLETPDVTESYQPVEVVPQAYEAARENAGMTQSESTDRKSVV